MFPHNERNAIYMTTRCTKTFSFSPLCTQIPDTIVLQELRRKQMVFGVVVVVPRIIQVSQSFITPLLMLSQISFPILSAINRSLSSLIIQYFQSIIQFPAFFAAFFSCLRRFFSNAASAAAAAAASVTSSDSPAEGIISEAAAGPVVTAVLTMASPCARFLNGLAAGEPAAPPAPAAAAVDVVTPEGSMGL